MTTQAGKSSSARVVAQLLTEYIALASFLFLVRFVARGYLIPVTDQECHIGGIAIDILAHGVRFPLLAYAPNEYDNGSFFSGLLTAISFALVGRNVIALKIVTHMISAAGALGALFLLRLCLNELGLTNRWVRRAAIATLVTTIALAPRVVTVFAMHAVGNHTEGSALGILLLALFAWRKHPSSPLQTAIAWALVGIALYLNKGVFLILPVLVLAEMLGPRDGRRYLSAAGGFLLGLLPELGIIVFRHGMGWLTIAFKAGHNSQGFPRSMVDSITTLAEGRAELLVSWALVLAFTTTLVVRALRNRDTQTRSLTLLLLVGTSWVHLFELSVMAKNGFDGYVVYGYPPLVVQFSVLVAWFVETARIRWGEATGAVMTASAFAITLLLYRPEAVAHDLARVSQLWRNQAGAACSWRFAEGFEREHRYGLALPEHTREDHAIVRCRSLSEPDQILDCIGGISREWQWRHHGRVGAEPPAVLTPAERGAYAYYYGTHRKGNAASCGDFADPKLVETCTAAVRLECLVYADIYTRFGTGEGLQRPQCTIPEPPMIGFWSEIGRDLFGRTSGTMPDLRRAWGDDDLTKCKPVFADCYPDA